MVSVFRVLRSGRSVSRSPLRGKDEQRIRRVAVGQLQRLEASERANVQSVPLRGGMVHLGLVEGKSRAARIYDRTETVTFSAAARYKYQNRFQCSVTCGTGAQTRLVRCILEGVGDTSCPELARPIERQQCSLDPCKKELPLPSKASSKPPSKPPKSEFQDRVDGSSNARMCPNESMISVFPEAYETSECVDKHPNCALVVKNGLCRIKYYKYSCCRCRE